MMTRSEGAIPNCDPSAGTLNLIIPSALTRTV